MSFSFNTIVGLCALGFAAVGCGAGEDVVDFADGGGELGDLQQGIGVSPTTNFTIGATTAQSRLACSFGQGSGTVCTMPVAQAGEEHLAYSYCIQASGNWTPAEIVRVKNAFATPAVTLTNAFNPGLNPDRPAFVHSCFGNFTVHVEKVAVAGSGSLIYHYVNTVLNTGPTLAEVPALSGTYKSHNAGAIQIDLASIIADQGTTAQEDSVLRHAAGYGLRTFLGFGGRSSGELNSYGRTNVDASKTSRVAGTAGEICRGQSYSRSTEPGKVFFGPACAGD